MDELSLWGSVIFPLVVPLSNLVIPKEKLNILWSVSLSPTAQNVKMSKVNNSILDVL